jgi:hypothetical protein
VLHIWFTKFLIFIGCQCKIIYFFIKKKSHLIKQVEKIPRNCDREEAETTLKLTPELDKKTEWKKLPKGIIMRVIGSVRIAFLPYLSERLPKRGIVTSVPNPIICTNHILIHLPEQWNKVYCMYFLRSYV